MAARSRGVLLLTNYRILFLPNLCFSSPPENEDEILEVPLGHITNVTLAPAAEKTGFEEVIQEATEGGLPLLVLQVATLPTA